MWTPAFEWDDRNRPITPSIIERKGSLRSEGRKKSVEHLALLLSGQNPGTNVTVVYEGRNNYRIKFR